MSINVIWDDEEKRVLLFAFAGRWTLDDLRAARDQAIAMMDSVPHRVDIILHLQHSADIPAGVIQEFRQGMVMAPDNLGALVLVGHNALVRITLSVFHQLYRHMSDTVWARGTLDQARAALVERDYR
jgi:hypothetical protein